MKEQAQIRSQSMAALVCQRQMEQMISSMACLRFIILQGEDITQVHITRCRYIQRCRKPSSIVTAQSIAVGAASRNSSGMCTLVTLRGRYARLARSLGGLGARRRGATFGAGAMPALRNSSSSASGSSGTCTEAAGRLRTLLADNQRPTQRHACSRPVSSCTCQAVPSPGVHSFQKSG